MDRFDTGMARFDCAAMVDGSAAFGRERDGGQCYRSKTLPVLSISQACESDNHLDGPTRPSHSSSLRGSPHVIFLEW